MIEVGSRKKNAIQIGRQKLLLQKNDRSMKILQGREIKYLDGSTYIDQPLFKKAGE